MADSKYTTMNAVELPCLHSACEALAADANTLELLARDHTVLPGRKARNYDLRGSVGDFLTHVRE